MLVLSHSMESKHVPGQRFHVLKHIETHRAHTVAAGAHRKMVIGQGCRRGGGRGVRIVRRLGVDL